MQLDECSVMIMRVIALRKRKDRMLNDLYNERRITWRLLKMDKTMTGDYLRMVLDNSYKREKR